MGVYKNSFTEDIFEHIKERLEDYENENWYSSDLVTELSMYENMNGAWIIGTWQAAEYIQNNWSEASDTFEYMRDNLGFKINPFENPEEFTFYMLAYGVETLCSYSTFLQENEHFTLDAKAIDSIVSDLDDVADIRPW